MKFELTTHIALQHPDWKSSELYYKNVLGLDTKMEENHLHIRNEELNLYIMENNELRGTVLEFNIDDVEVAKEYLEKHGCIVVKWEGKGKDCYMKDPYGLVFNLWENNKG
ncbi:MAG: hypothetical protein IIB45_03265 [Candidatus Marinimicrobia bacterium]|nr:hypothetical protein [Candidatus Neomarinimicrobiota bacterium]